MLKQRNACTGELRNQEDKSWMHSFHLHIWAFKEELRKLQLQLNSNETINCNFKHLYSFFIYIFTGI